MAIQAEASNSFESPEVGIHNAVLTQVVDLGLVPNKFYDPSKKGSYPTNRQIVYVFQLETRKSDGTRFLKEFWFNLYSNPKSTIGKFLSSWFGRVLTGEELTLDHEQLIGRPVQLILGKSAKDKVVVTGAAPANPNNALQIEGYDFNEYAKQIRERALKQEDAQLGNQFQQPQQQFQQPYQAQQFNQPNYQQQPQGFPQPYQAVPPQQFQPPVQQPQTIQQYHQQQQQTDGFGLNVPTQQTPPDNVPF